MEKTKKEILREVKAKAPDLYNEILTEEERQQIENGQCHHPGHHARHNHHNNCGWGGHRHGAGRPKTFCSRKAITKQVDEITINKIKKYAISNSISENQAMEKLINAGYDVLKTANEENANEQIN